MTKSFRLYGQAVPFRDGVLDTVTGQEILGCSLLNFDGPL